MIDQVVRHGLARHVEEGVSQQARLLDFVAASVKTKRGASRTRKVKTPTDLRLARPATCVGDGCWRPRILGDSGDNVPATSGGLVFLNSCPTANSPDRGMGSFLNAFHDADFSGIIATEARTLDNEACPFGLEVMTAFLDQREPIGEVLTNLKSVTTRLTCKLIEKREP